MDCLQDIVTVVEQSSDVNVAQLCGTESGDVIVPTFLGTFFRKVANIKKFHHFHFAEGSTTVRLQEFVDSPFLEESLARRKMPDDVTMTPVIHPKGLDAKRQWYLYDEIRPFTAYRCQDVSTPRPAVVKPKQKPREAEMSDSDDDVPPPPSKSARGRGRGRRGKEE